jgi:hypothetical protein
LVKDSKVPNSRSAKRTTAGSHWSQELKFYYYYLFFSLFPKTCLRLLRAPTVDGPTATGDMTRPLFTRERVFSHFLSDSVIIRSESRSGRSYKYAATLKTLGASAFELKVTDLSPVVGLRVKSIWRPGVAGRSVLCADVACPSPGVIY